MSALTEVQRLLPLLDSDGGEDPERDRILAVARDHLLAHGYERFSTDRLARDAGVSRQTVYRRCGRKTDIFDAVVRAEFRQVLPRLLSLFQLDDEMQRFVAVWCEVIVVVHDNDLVRSLREHDPDFVSQLWASMDGATAALMRTVFAMIAPAGSDGQVIAEASLRLVVSLYLQPTPLIPLTDPESIESFVRRYLAPMAVGTPVISAS
ncbi:TetR/AcrR family transcriptional regulator [Nocardia asteroides]|uniref:TetR/AcrR family transcriptional regulator n=1 Tax=Nocardia asteroides TaxID=1824 RepID=UPI0037C6F6CA